MSTQMHDIDRQKAEQIFGKAGVKQMQSQEWGKTHISQGNLECSYRAQTDNFVLRQRVKHKGAIARVMDWLGQR